MSKNLSALSAFADAASISAGPRAQSAPPPLLATDPPVVLSLSFASENYSRRGGQRVIADQSPVDLAAAGLNLPHDLGRGRCLIAAFVVNSPAPGVRAALSVPCTNPCRAFIRARCNNQWRIAETEVVFSAGSAQVDLPVVGLSTDRVQAVNEQWTFEYRIVGAGFCAIHFAVGDRTVTALPVRIYFTAAAPINPAPRESYYHLATAIPGGRDAAQLQRDIWSHFTSFGHGGFLTNAAGQRLGFWRDRKPGLNQADFIVRSAQQLIAATDSSCRGWAELLHETFAIHGIRSAVRAIRPRLSRVVPHLGLPSFMVPDAHGNKSVTRTIGILVAPFQWKPAEQISRQAFDADDGELHTAGFHWKLNNPADPHAARWPEADVIDLHRPAPGVDSAGGIFGNHAVVLVQNGTEESWYDPSFGIGPHHSLRDYEDQLLGRGQMNPGGLFAIVGWKRQCKANPVTGELEESSAGLLLGAAPAPPGPVLEAVDPG